MLTALDREFHFSRSLGSRFSDHSLGLVFPKVFRLKAETTRKGGPVDQPGMSIAETTATRLNRPLGMLQAPALRKEQESRKVAGSNPARSTTRPTHTEKCQNDGSIRKWYAFAVIDSHGKSLVAHMCISKHVRTANATEPTPKYSGCSTETARDLQYYTSS
jgi:hypothetical protein